MRNLFILLCFIIPVVAPAQELTEADRKAIYQAVVNRFADTALVIMNETYKNITRSEITGFFQKEQLVEVLYQQPVQQYLSERNIFIDTAKLFRQIDRPYTDTLMHYLPAANIFNARIHDEKYTAMWDKLMKTKRMTVLSNILFLEKNGMALVKIHIDVFRTPEIPRVLPPDRRIRIPDNPSKIIILKKVGTEWAVWGVIDRLPTGRMEG